MRSIQADAVWTCAKLHRAGKIVTPMCLATIRAEFFPTGLPDCTAHLSPLTRNTLLVPHDGEAHIWRERTHDSRLAAKTQAVRFRDLICLRARVDDDEQNQPDFEMTVEMWERASMSTKPSRFPKREIIALRFGLTGRQKRRIHPLDTCRSWSDLELRALSHAGTHSRMIERNWRRCCVQC